MNRLDYIHKYLLNIAYFVLVVYFFLYSTTIGDNFLKSKIVLLVCLVAIATGTIINIKKNIKNKPILFILIAIMAMTEFFNISIKHYHITEFDNLLLYSLFFMTIINGQNVYHFIRISFYTKLGLALTTILLYLFGVIQEVTLDRGDSVRHSLGFYHPNTLGFIIMCLTIECVYLYIKKINWIHISLLAFLNIFIYYISQSRTSFICVVLFLLVAFLNNYSAFLTRHSVKIVQLALIPVLCLFSIVLPWIYNSKNIICVGLDLLFSFRLQSGHFYLKDIGISLFGRPFPETLYVKSLNINLLLDSAFLRVLIQCGVVFFVILSLTILYRCSQLLKNGFVFEVSIIVITLIYSFFERATNNVFLYSVILILFKEGHLKSSSIFQWFRIKQFLKRKKVD